MSLIPLFETDRIQSLHSVFGAEKPLFPEIIDDWTFYGEQTRDLTHCYHDYPARMIPQVSRKLLDRFGENARTLFDPYCGTGTSLVEGRVRGLSVIGTDLNPLARFISVAKTATVSVAKLDDSMRSFKCFTMDKAEHETKTVFEIEEISRLDFWFKPDVIKKLTNLRVFIEEITDEAVRNFFFIAFSETVRECSNTRNSEFKLYRMPSDKLEHFMPSVYETIHKKLTRNRSGLIAFMTRLESMAEYPPSSQVFSFNTVEGVPQGAVAPESVDIVLTSPPYGDSATTVAYGQYSRLSAAWLGLQNLAQVDQRLMGGKPISQIPHFSSELLNIAVAQISEVDEKRAREVAAFYADLEASVRNVAPLVKRGGHVCYVVGNRRVKGVTLPTDDAVRRAFENQGFQWHDTFVRSIPNKRMPSRNSPTNVSGAQDVTMTNEFIVVLRRQ